MAEVDTEARKRVDSDTGKPGLASGPTLPHRAHHEAKDSGVTPKSWHNQAVGVVVGGVGDRFVHKIPDGIKSVSSNRSSKMYARVSIYTGLRTHNTALRAHKKNANKKNSIAERR
jgi:hypothetical protein